MRRKSLTEALKRLEKAAELAPDEPRYAYAYGIALHSTGQGDKAVEALERAHRRLPGDRDLLTALVNLLRDRGKTDAALLYARKLVEQSSGDAQARVLLHALER